MNNMLSQIAYDKQRDELLHKPPIPKPQKKKLTTGSSGFIAISREKRQKVALDPHISKTAIIGHYRPRYNSIHTRSKSAKFRPI